MGRTFLAIVGLIAFLSGHTALRPLPHIRLIPRSRSNARRIPINFRTRCQTGNLEERLSGCRADFPVGSSFNFQDHRRATPRTVHLSSSQVRYSSQANTGNGLGLPEPGHRPNSLGRWPAGGKIGPAPQLETPLRAGESLGSFTPRYEILWGGLKPNRATIQGRGAARGSPTNGTHGRTQGLRRGSSGAGTAADRGHLGRVVLSSAR
jgi:hypothetical protein